MELSKIIITGATGFIGRKLVQLMLLEGYEVIVISRNKAEAAKVFGNACILDDWGSFENGKWEEYTKSGGYAIINLAGDNISKGRWTNEKKERILKSRVKAGSILSEAISKAKEKPILFIQASAIGYYGDRGEEIITEEANSGMGFLANVVREWENSTAELEKMGIKRVIVRSAVVLGESGGLLPKLVKPFRYYLGAILGSGKQWFSWIHIEDEVNAIMYLLRERAEGIYNLSSPNPIRMKEMCETIAKIIEKPCWLRIPSFVLRIIFGEMARELILVSQRVIPSRLIERGFKFKYENFASCVAMIKK
jgi:uncharacterized protein (TIGR01777 family)